MRPGVNCHIHLPPNFSAFESVQQAVDLAAEQGVRVLGASNYYDYTVYGQFDAAATAKGVFPLFGLEIICLIDELVKAEVKINDPGNPGKMYICGKGITRFGAMTPEARRLLNTIRHNDSTRMAAMVQRMNDVFAAKGLDLDLNEAAVKAMVVRRHGCLAETVYLQERHVCQAFQERLFERILAGQRIATLTNVFGATPKAGEADAVKIQNEIRSHLMKAGKPAYVEETFVSFEEAYRLILELGGIPAYPVLADGTRPICPFEDPIDSLIERLNERNIHAVEFIPVRNTPEVLSRYVQALRRAGKIVTAGTEHNTLDLLPIAPTCLNGAPIPAEVQETFWEGACVVAAHQSLSREGKAGFANRHEERQIAALAAHGEKLLATR